MHDFQFVGLDFETYASTDLLTRGLNRYVNCPDFQVLLAAVHGPVPGQKRVFDFVHDEQAADKLEAALTGWMIAAHNAGFEQAVLQQLGLDYPSQRFIDTAVLARAAGAAGKLEAAAPQLLGTDKLDSGYHLIKVFSVPGKYQEDLVTGQFMPQITEEYPEEWKEFIHYCEVDAELSFKLAELLMPSTTYRELAYTHVTMDMNMQGWRVDLALVEEMQRRYHANVAAAIAEFRRDTGAHDLNLSSFPQMQQWCKDREVNAKSFDEDSVKRMLAALENKLTNGTTLSDTKRANYEQVVHLLRTKQIMGGSSLKKLETIMNTTGFDGRLRDQYLHCGAGATFRTSGRGVQMQNLKRLNGEGDDVELLFDEVTDWDNSRLASNLRQVFTASHPNGRLVVGDFSSVESRGLAWQAGEQWKLDAYAKGHDLYKVQASKIFGVPYDQVVKAQRQIGKVGELACGYGAGADAVHTFAAKMGVEMTQQEAAKLVVDWRKANEGIVAYWKALDDALHLALTQARGSVTVTQDNCVVIFTPVPAPESLRKQLGDPGLLSLKLELVAAGNEHMLTRVIHGAQIKGRNVGYYKPSERKTGELWSNSFVDPKTKQRRAYTIYGGKLSGILTQSLCRELFFASLHQVQSWSTQTDNVKVVGQFHDEIVVDWVPGATQYAVSLDTTKSMMERFMSSSVLPDFPLASEIKADYRYTK